MTEESENNNKNYTEVRRIKSKKKKDRTEKTIVNAQQKGK